MDSLETKPESKANGGSLAEGFAALQRQTTVLLVGLVVLSGTLSVLLWRQSHYAWVDLEGAKAQYLPVLQFFKQNDKPRFEKLEAQLAEYAQTHTDFAQLLSLFRVQVVVTPSAAPATGAPPKSAPVPSNSSPPAAPKTPAPAPVKK